MSTALAIKCDELGDDLSPIETLTVSCYRCDEDNPLCIPPEDLPRLQGHGPGPCAARRDRQGDPGVKAGAGEDRLGIGSRVPRILTSTPKQGG